MLRTVHDRQELAALFEPDPGLHLYELGDLDDYFWPYTTCYRMPAGRTAALVYTGAAFGPLLLALGRPDTAAEQRELLSALQPVLPRSFYAHVTNGAEDVLSDYRVSDHGVHLKMLLKGFAPASGEPVVRLGPDDLTELQELYAAAYPDNSFDPRMLGAGEYAGIRRDGRLVAVAGVHIHSRSRRIAALGNVTTLPELRGQGLAAVAASALCRTLLSTVDHIGLNVQADNTAAVSLYQRLGFEITAEYREMAVTSCC
ncbi:GNAT family N-acetyltransferase [Longispora albida]|uniref:GNAT family N-acetyltransferase n=1 Tax=Longispora albida TaxID=203523 RepID=UPI00036DB480|nr:GNAT family N-acetyltransferase [Longispora albida]